MAKEARKELRLDLSEPKVWQGDAQVPLEPKYTRLILNGSQATGLQTVGGTEDPPPKDEPLFVEMEVLRQAYESQTHERTELSKSNQWAIYEPTEQIVKTLSPESRYVRYPRTLSLRNIPDELSRFISDEEEQVGCVTLGKTLRERSIKYIQTENHGRIVRYAASRIIFISQSFIEGTSTIVFIDDDDNVASATRHLF